MNLCPNSYREGLTIPKAAGGKEVEPFLIILGPLITGGVGDPDSILPSSCKRRDLNRGSALPLR